MLKKQRPLIGVTDATKRNQLAFGMLCLAVIIAGGKPVRIDGNRRDIGYDIQGLVLGGGTDIFPDHYGQSPKDNYEYDHKRDAVEVYWAERAYEENIPTLGVCRGCQLMNVVRGGTLHLAVSQAYQSAIYPEGWHNRILFRKNMIVQSDTQLHGILRCNTVSINSLHSQSIDKPGEGIVISARERNGIVQAIEDNKRDFFIGVQFHPEYLVYRQDMRRLFRSLIKNAAMRIIA